jgi:CRISPR-associated protein Cmr3
MSEIDNTPNNLNHRIVCVTLTPLGNFFFGGRKQTEVEKEKDYYIKSLYYPQQTVILGMLRQELLVQNKLFPLDKDNREKAARLIGESSFDPENRGQEFGAIEALSPVFLKRNDHCIFHILPKDHKHTFTPQYEGKTFFNHPNTDAKEFLPCFEGYDAKKGEPDVLGSKDSPQEFIQLNDIFSKDEQVGIKKGKSGQIEEESYYKQVFLRLAKGYAFSFYLRLKTVLDEKPVKFSDNFVFVGGERSGFRMKIEPVEKVDENRAVKDLFDQTLPGSSGPKIFLTGDAFVDTGILSACDFAVSASVSFRNFRSYVRTTRKFWNLTDKEDQETPFLGERYNLLARGTVLYYGNNRETLDRLKTLLDEGVYQKIGFNYYKVYPSPGEEGKE